MELHHVFALACFIALCVLVFPLIGMSDEEIVNDLRFRHGWSEARVSGEAPWLSCSKHDFTRRAISGKTAAGPVSGVYCSGPFSGGPHLKQP